MTHPVIAPKKLIEVALPLDDINEASAREKSIRHGHPSTLHLWWARRPLAAARAVIFAQLVNDPASLWEAQHPGETPNKQQKSAFTKRRNELFELIRQLVKWENTTNEKVLNEARAEIRRSWKEVCALNKHHPDATTLFDPEKMPGLHDPFAGGGTIPLEAQRLGLQAYASDLNPVAVLINKAMIEIPPKFAGQPPIGPLPPGEKQQEMPKAWPGATGLAEDVRRYGAWMRNEAIKRLGHLYPPVEITAEMVKDRPELGKYAGQKLTVIAWIWARTVQSPNPAFAASHSPLLSSYLLSSKKQDSVWLEAGIEAQQVRFRVRSGSPPEDASIGSRTGKASDFVCLLSGSPISRDHIRAEALAGRLGHRLVAIVAEGTRERVYLDPTPEHTSVIGETSFPLASPTRQALLQGSIPTRAYITGGVCSSYGLNSWGTIYSDRQAHSLAVLVDLIGRASELASESASKAGFPLLFQLEFSRAISLYLAMCVDRIAMSSNSLVRWNSVGEKAQHCFGRQAFLMIWDYAETNPTARSTGSIQSAVEYCADAVAALPATTLASVKQSDARRDWFDAQVFISTDPPYYDNIGYAVLSDFFYAWVRASQRSNYGDILSAVSTPKDDELIAVPAKHGGKEAAESYFLMGMRRTLGRLIVRSHPAAPMTVYYAFKQSDTNSRSGTSSTGWETFLGALVGSGIEITGTWPLRTEMRTRQVAMEANALASSVVLVCRRRPDDAPTVSRREFLRELNAMLPLALDEMTKGSGEDRSPVAPVDLSQAIIGPGMAIFSKYEAVLEADGKPMTVKTALQLINRFLAEDDFDPDTQFCLHWFEQYGWSEGPYGEADVLARAKATAVSGLVEAGVLVSATGKARLRRGPEYPTDWDPAKDDRIPVWEALHQLVRAFRAAGEHGAAKLLVPLAGRSEAIRQLGYRLYTLCERREMADEARGYNELVAAWAQVETAAEKLPKPATQLKLGLE